MRTAFNSVDALCQFTLVLSNFVEGRTMLAFAIGVIWVSAAVSGQLIPCPFDESEIFNNIENAPVPETRFELYTRKNAHFYQELRDEETILQSNYDPQKKTVICIHGYVSDPSTLFPLKSAYLQVMDCNFIMVNWKVGAFEGDFLKAARNVPIVALFTAKNLEKLKELTRCRLKDVHVIGFSLGGQLAGFIGKYVRSEKIGRITALDPCGVCFEEFSPAHKLHLSDAEFVDVIVTNRGPVVVNEPTGHVMFLPDGGSLGRGCAHITDGQIWTPVFPLQICSHFRAMELFAGSLKYSFNCSHVGYKCPDYETFERGECFGCGGDQRNCVEMGFNADSYADKITDETAVFYTDTTFTGDYCLPQYHVEVVIANTIRSKNEIGILYLIINGGMRDEVEIMLKPSANKMRRPEELIPGEKYTYLVHSHEIIQYDIIKTIHFYWISYGNDEASQIYISCVSILPMNNIKYFYDSAIFATAGTQSIPPEVVSPLQITDRC